MIDPQAIATKPTLSGDHIRLAPLAPLHVDALFGSLDDPESLRLTGTHQTFTREQIERWCATRAEQSDRLDFAIEDVATGEFAGDLSLNGIDVDNESAGFRIALISKFQGRGFGSEATMLLLDYAFTVIGLHRVQLDVYEFNERARHVYEKCGFVVEGRLRDALTWDGKRYDALVMSALSHEYRAREKNGAAPARTR